MLTMIARLLKILNSESEPGQISLALCLAMIVGLTPLYSPHNLLVILIVLLIRINLSAAILGWLFFSGLAYLLDPLFHRIGGAVLQAQALSGMWTAMYNTTFFRLAHFNNSILMGSLLFCLAGFVPCYLLFNALIRRYRDHLLAWVQKSRIVQGLKASRLYTVYQSVSGWGGMS